MSYFDIEKILAFFSAGGPMESHKANYRYRSEQVHLVEHICRAFNDQEFLLAEAGTGVGKTFAYLLPAVFWALYSEEKVVIATKTKALQHQITAVDIPELQKVLGWEFAWAEAKGRENYLCWHKYNRILRGRKKLDPAQIKLVEALLSWAEDTRTGDRQELTLPERLMKEWGVIGAHRKNCLRDKCRFREKCFYVSMLKRLTKAPVIVVNHALLLADLAVDNSILPQYRYLVIDEAHNLEREAFDKLCCRLSYFEIEDTLRALHGTGNAGLLRAIRDYYPSCEAEAADINNLTNSLQDLNSQLFAAFTSLMGKQRDDRGVKILRTSEPAETCPELYDIHNDWQYTIDLLIEKIARLTKNIVGQDEENELLLLKNMLLELSDTAYKIIAEDGDNENYIQWLIADHGKVTEFCSSPVNVGGILEEKLYTQLKSLVMVSATLTVSDRFDYIINKLGLYPYAEQERLNLLLEKSPFPYDENAQLITLREKYEPNDAGFQPYVEEVLTDIITAMGGRTLILFTSRLHMLQTAKKLKTVLKDRDVQILVQNEDGNFAALIRSFTTAHNIVLLGLETFWEGIDLRGDLLSCLVIVRLPFRSPGEPYAQAAERNCKQMGRNRFQSFMLPDAALRFKQGVGRLIRSEQDKGLLIVLDGRLDNRWYGSYFKNSIPINNHLLIEKQHIFHTLKNWLSVHPFTSLQKTV